MYSLKAASCKLKSVTPRKEYHGEELVTSGSMSITYQCRSDALDMIRDGLTNTFYTGKMTSDLVDDADGKPGYQCELRIPEAVFPIKIKMPDIYYTVTIHYGIDDSDMVMRECKIPAASIKCHLGGMVEITMTINFHPSEKQSALLWHMVQEEVSISIVSEVYEAEDVGLEGES